MQAALGEAERRPARPADARETVAEVPAEPSGGVVEPAPGAVAGSAVP